MNRLFSVMAAIAEYSNSKHNYKAFAGGFVVRDSVLKIVCTQRGLYNSMLSYGIKAVTVMLEESLVTARNVS